LGVEVPTPKYPAAFAMNLVVPPELNLKKLPEKVPGVLLNVEAAKSKRMPVPWKVPVAWVMFSREAVDPSEDEVALALSDSGPPERIPRSPTVNPLPTLSD
jgi:hypothetical protein